MTKKQGCEVVAYLRVSTEGQEIESQKMAVLEFANREKITVDRFIEIVISSRKKAQRKGLEMEVEKLQAGDMIVVSELSRLGRSLGQIIILIDTLVKREIRLIAIKENIRIDGEQDIQSKVMITLFGLFAELERDLISQRTKEGLQRAKASGKKLGRPKGKKGKSKLDGKEKQIAEYLDKKVSKASIARILGVSSTTLHHFIKTRKLEAGKLLKDVL